MGVSIKQKVLATLDLVGAEQVSFGFQAKIGTSEPQLIFWGSGGKFERIEYAS